MKMHTNNKILGSLLRGLIIAFSAVVEIFAIALLFDKKITIDFFVLIFSLALTVYSFDFIKEYSESLKVANINIKYLYTIPICFVIIFLTISLIFGNFFSFLFSISILMFGLLYDLFFKKITKLIPAFKDIFVALNWNMILWLFLIYYGYNLNIGFFLLFIFVFLRDSVNASFCDLKDFVSDGKQKLSTLVHVLGKEKLFLFLQVLNILSVILLIIFSTFRLVPFLSLALIVPVIITSVLLIYSKSNKNYSPYFVDIEYYFWFLAVVIFTWVLK